MQVRAQIQKFNCEIDTGAGSKIMSLYIYQELFGDRRLELQTVHISGYGDSPVANKRSCTVVLLTCCQTPRKATFQVTDMRECLILGRETA